MAATGTPTPNLGLRIPVGTDPASVDDINYNSNLLDTVLGAVGNTSVKDQLDGLSDQIALKTYTSSNEKIIAYKLLNVVTVLIWGQTFESDGKTIGTIPSDCIPNAVAQVEIGKIYNGSSYVDCFVRVNTNGNVEVTDAFSSAIPGGQIAYLSPRRITYIKA